MALGEALVEDVQWETAEEEDTAMGDTRSTFTCFQPVANLHLWCIDPSNRSDAPRTLPPKTLHLSGSHTGLPRFKESHAFSLSFL